MSVHLQVCIRCRPFAHEDKLGLIMKEEEDGNSSIELLDQNGTPHSRRGFAKSWWSAYNCRFNLFLEIYPNTAAIDMY